MYAAPKLLQSPNEMKTRNMYQISKLSKNWLSGYANLEGWATNYNINMI